MKPVGTLIDDLFSVNTRVEIHPGDNRGSLRRLIDEGVRVHSVVTDPPYGLSFMGRKWDGSGIERDPEFWKLIYDILLPGGYVFAFSGSRTGHWQACAMEMAGFVMHPMHGWVFGSGFPKAHAADKAIDKYLGAKGEFGEPKTEKHAGWISCGRMRGADATENHDGWQRPWMDDPEQVSNAARRYIPATPEAAQWEGWAYGTQAQKPALEPIYLGQKPFSEKTGAANLLKHGVGAVNIGTCRIPAADVMGERRRHGGGVPGNGTSYEMPDSRGYIPEGRHPSNLILDGSPEVVAMFPDTGKSPATYTRSVRAQGNWLHAKEAGTQQHGFGDSGSAARFFHHFPPDADPLFYHPKAGKADRAGSKHPTVKPIALMQYLIRHITPPGGVVLDPFAGSGTTAEAARREGFDCVLMEAEPEYLEFIKERFE